jgi:hypothetical protein
MDVSSLPISHLHVIAKTCPRALETYLILWSNQDAYGKIKINMKEVVDRFVISKAKFNHHIRELQSSRMIETCKAKDILNVRMVRSDVDAICS